MSKGTKLRRQAKKLTTIVKGYKAYRHGPRIEEDEGWRHKRSSEDRAEILNYVVTIRGNNILWIAYFCKWPVNVERICTLTGNYLENRNADTNEQILHDGLALLDHHSFHRSDLVDAIVNTKRTSRDCNIKCNLNSSCCGEKESEQTLERQRIKGFTDITVDRNPVDHVPVPYNRVDAL